MKDNKIIAEFMGCTNPFNEIHDATLYKVEQGTFELDELQYHTSWDWLMPVMAKLVKDFGSGWQFEEGCNLNNRYNAVVKFIKQLNN